MILALILLAADPVPPAAPVDQKLRAVEAESAKAAEKAATIEKLVRSPAIACQKCPSCPPVPVERAVQLVPVAAPCVCPEEPKHVLWPVVALGLFAGCALGFLAGYYSTR